MRLHRPLLLSLGVLVLVSLPGYLQSVFPAALPERATLPPELARDYRAVDFGELAIPEEGLAIREVGAGAAFAVPTPVQAMDGARVALRGYAIPLAYEGAQVTELLLAARNDLGCCFGVGMQPTEWVLVRWSPPGIDVPPTTTPITVLGRLQVVPETVDGALQSLYRMTGERLLP